MRSHMSIKFAILAWIFTLYVTISSGPMINRWITIKNDINGLSAHQKLQNLNVTTSSVFGEIEDIREQLYYYVAIFLIVVLAVSFISTIMTTCDEKPSTSTTSDPPEKNPLKPLKSLLLLLFFASFIILTTLSAILYRRLINVQMDHCNTDFNDLHDKMISSLKENFGSDNFTIGTNISFEWNNLFIDYECCGVNKVTGTTNDFDNTTWCTTSGTCQATASQIPKTCCKGVTKYDYQSAPNNCHSSVNPGEFYEKGCYSVIKKELIKEQIQFDTVVDYLLSEWVKVVIAMGFCSLLGLCGIFYFIKLCLVRKGCTCPTIQNASSDRNNGANANGNPPVEMINTTS